MSVPEAHPECVDNVHRVVGSTRSGVLDYVEAASEGKEASMLDPDMDP